MSTRPAFTPLAAADFAAAFPGSHKVYVDGAPGVRVPMREIGLSNGEALRVYDASGAQGHDVQAGLPKLRKAWEGSRRATPNVTQLHYARKVDITPEMEFI